MTMVVRNEATTLPVSLRHHLAHGADAVYVIDHGSTDGTSRLLAHLEREGLPVEWQRREGPFDQLALATELATRAAEAGADWVVPADGDELWHAPGGLKAFLAGHAGADAVSVPFVNFAQWRHARVAGPSSFLTVWTRPARPVKKSRYDALPPEARPPWVARRPSRKAIARAGVLLDRGGHEPLDGAAVVRESSQGACLHVPLREPAAIARKPRAEIIRDGLSVEEAWRDNSWVVPTRFGTRASTPLVLDFRIARIALRHLRQARRDLAAAGIA
jgi:hypothetical protein